jgi:type III secretion protein T
MNTFTATESYLSMLLSLPQLQPMTVLAVFFLTLGRVLPIVGLAPFLGSTNVKGPMRIGFALALVAIFLPQNLLVVHGEIPFTEVFIGYFLKELLVGFILGFLATVPFVIAQMAGSLIDFQRGASSLQVSDPTTQTQTGPIGLLANFVLIALFFSFDGPFIYLNGVADSYRLIPVDGIISSALMNAQTSFWKEIYGLAGMMMSIAAQLAAPALIGILLTDLFLGIANRLAPQVQIVFLGIALKSWVGIALLTAAWGMMLQVMIKQSTSWFQTLNWMIQTIGQSYMQKH